LVGELALATVISSKKLRGERYEESPDILAAACWTLPPAPDYVTVAVELCGGMALIPVLLGAIFLVHGKAGFFFMNPDGGWKFLAFGSRRW
jgi:hypothetical protein